MFGRINRGEIVIGLCAISIRGRVFRRGPALVSGSYIGKMRDRYMVKTRRGKIYLCSDVRKAD
jgi:predicted polyphosphate/ATP-dependent NAD kinase